MESHAGPERRQYVRLDRIIPLDCNLINDVQSIELARKRKAIIQNISAGGIRLVLEELEERFLEGLYSGGVKLGLEFRLPGAEKPIRAIAKVAWLTKTVDESTKTKFIMGLEFVDITTIDQDLIRDYVIRSYLEGKTE